MKQKTRTVKGFQTLYCVVSILKKVFMIEQEDLIINRVTESGLMTLNLETYFPKQEFAIFDLKDYLFMELILKEKDFRAACKSHDWLQYKNKILLVYCSTDAIIPMWAYMLVAQHAANFAYTIFQGTREEFLKAHYAKVISTLNTSEWNDKRVVIKGCGGLDVPAEAYVSITRVLTPHVVSIMYGEPCSTVPIYKKARLS